MDPVTHGLIGATVTVSGTRTDNLRYAALTGGAAAMLPDLDVLINSSTDPLLQLEFHRQFTHSLLFIPVGALLASLLLWWITRKQLSFTQTYLCCLLGTATAGAADALTSYGVQLLWPFAGTRFAWNIISVFDPLFTLGLIVALSLALVNRRRIPVFMGLAWMTFYLLFGLVQRERAQHIAGMIADRRGHPVEQLFVKPTIANEWVWSIRYVSKDTLYADGVRLLPFTDAVVFEGSAAPLLNWQKTYAEYRGTILYGDIRRFSKLSEGVLVKHPDHPRVIGDGRYALLPTSVRPLWGITVDTSRSGRHTDFKAYRDPGPKTGEKFIEMLLGFDKE